jgi:hypothetical protein
MATALLKFKESIVPDIGMRMFSPLLSQKSLKPECSVPKNKADFSLKFFYKYLRHFRP